MCLKSAWVSICFLLMSMGFCESWQEAQIHSDLAYWKEQGISRSSIRKAFEMGSVKSFALIYVSYKNGEWTFLGEPYIAHRRRSLNIYDLIPKLIGKRPLPESFEFIISTQDRASEACYFGVPVFCFAKSRKNKNAICMPDHLSLTAYPGLKKDIKQGGLVYPWGEKKELAFWRGGTTGGFFRLDNCLDYPRPKLVMMSVESPSLLDARFTHYVQTDSEDTKAKLKLFCPVAPKLSPKEHLRYKYLVNVDGNSCSYSRMFWMSLSQ